MTISLSETPITILLRTLCSPPGGTTDLGETFEQRVGILFGLDDIFTLKNLYF